MPHQKGLHLLNDARGQPPPPLLGPLDVLSAAISVLTLFLEGLAIMLCYIGVMLLCSRWGWEWHAPPEGLSQTKKMSKRVPERLFLTAPSILLSVMIFIIERKATAQQQQHQEC